MRALIQRVLSSELSIEGRAYSHIGGGLLVFLGVTHEDTEEDVEWLSAKIAALRIFDDENGVMNLDVRQVGGELMVVSQFTLYASTKKGNRPSYIRSAPEPIAKPLYEKFISAIKEKTGAAVATGVFGADMQIDLINDGPVTLMMDSKNRE